MSSPFSDFSQLKALRKDLEKQESVPDSGSKSGVSVKRQHTRVVKGREEMLGAQAARERCLRVGLKITLMDSNDKGTITAVWKDHVDVDIDGLTFPVKFGDFIVNDAAEDEKMRRICAGNKDRKEHKKASSQSLPNETTVDLHIERIPGGIDAPQGFELPFQIEYFKRIIRQYQKHRGMRINIVHGVGDGILRDAIRKDVDETFALTCTWTPGIDGVTVITIK